MQQRTRARSEAGAFAPRACMGASLAPRSPPGALEPHTAAYIPFYFLRLRYQPRA